MKHLTRSIKYVSRKHGGKCHCVPRQIHLWVLLFGPCPFLIALLFLWRNAHLAGGFVGRLGFLVFFCFVVVSICRFCTGQLSPSTIFSHRLCLYQDRALVRHRPIPKEKKNRIRRLFRQHWAVFSVLRSCALVKLDKVVSCTSVWTPSRAALAAVSWSTCCCKRSKVSASLLSFVVSVLFVCRRGMSVRNWVFFAVPGVNC